MPTEHKLLTKAYFFCIFALAISFSDRKPSNNSAPQTDCCGSSAATIGLSIATFGTSAESCDYFCPFARSKRDARRKELEAAREMFPKPYRSKSFSIFTILFIGPRSTQRTLLMSMRSLQRTLLMPMCSLQRTLFYLQ